MRSVLHSSRSSYCSTAHCCECQLPRSWRANTQRASRRLMRLPADQHTQARAPGADAAAPSPHCALTQSGLGRGTAHRGIGGTVFLASSLAGATFNFLPRPDRVRAGPFSPTRLTDDPRVFRSRLLSPVVRWSARGCSFGEEDASNASILTL